ncbi:hypothetical protein KP79_PYT26220 [Mizuhopecten yessoensis]|uniref:Uncharacterized protein n=1 Tax=Mizuhopecten yessoensis TaxID=6573 RepID=A0A210QDG6_MIZYE|nr:hypothetical protein KP79_PYT26220 [Mizuhopecten yessoensis]
MELRNTPITGIELSPSQLLLGRATRTTLPVKRTQLNPLGFEPCAIKSSLEEQKARQKVYFDRGTHSLPPLHVGDNIRFIPPNVNQASLAPGKVVGKTSTPRSYIVEHEGGKVRRNRRDLFHTKENFADITTQKSIPIDDVISDDVTPSNDIKLSNESKCTESPSVVNVNKNVKCADSASVQNVKFSRVSGREIKVPPRFKDS